MINKMESNDYITRVLDDRGIVDIEDLEEAVYNVVLCST